MAFVRMGDGGLDYFPCHYGASRLMFRGPRRDLTRSYVAVLGGSESYGRFVTAPYPALLEEALGLPVANLACQNAGVDVYLSDPATLEVATAAHLAVVQITGAQNLTNRFYTVHPRRNDRFIAATPLLRSMYREVDFTEIHFTRHLVQVLAAKGEDRFAPIAEELKTLWVQRMTALLGRMPQRVVLLWMADRPPGAEAAVGMVSAPWLVDRAMVDALRPLSSDYIELVRRAETRVDEGLFAAIDDPAALGLPGVMAHQEAALTLLPVIERLM